MESSPMEPSPMNLATLRPPQKSASFNPAIHAFRGFAILNVLIIHCFGFSQFYALRAEDSDQGFLKVLKLLTETLFHDATLYFALISGALFTLVLESRGWTRFFKSKALNIALPYLLFTALFSWAHWPPSGEFAIFSGSFIEFIKFVAHNLITGEAVFTFWYLPILFGLYLLTPLFSGLFSVDKKGWGILIVVLLPLYFSRAWPEFTWANYAYFGGAYVLGMVVGKHYEQSIALLKKAQWWLFGMGGISSALVYYCLLIELKPYGLVSLSESAWYVQKLCFAGLILLLFECRLKTLPAWLKLLGDYAFPLYFIHGYLLFWAYPLHAFFDPFYSNALGVLAISTLNTLFISVISLGIIHLIKVVFRRRSKYIIGA